MLIIQSLIGINKRSKRHCIHEYSFQSLIGIKKRSNLLLKLYLNTKIFSFLHIPLKGLIEYDTIKMIPKRG